jgi:hypothetical protein
MKADNHSPSVSSQKHIPFGFFRTQYPLSILFFFNTLESPASSASHIIKIRVTNPVLALLITTDSRSKSDGPTF